MYVCVVCVLRRVLVMPWHACPCELLLLCIQKKTYLCLFPWQHAKVWRACTFWEEEFKCGISPTISQPPPTFVVMCCHGYTSMCGGVGVGVLWGMRVWSTQACLTLCAYWNALCWPSRHVMAATEYVLCGLRLNVGSTFRWVLVSCEVWVHWLVIASNLNFCPLGVL